MIRAAAKNHQFVAVVVDPRDYPQLLQQLKDQDSSHTGAWRRKLAWKAFQHCSTYDAAVAEWLWKQAGAQQVPAAACCCMFSSSLHHCPRKLCRPCHPAPAYQHGPQVIPAANSKQRSGCSDQAPHS